MRAGSTPPRLILAWEALAGPVQVVIAFPVLVTVLFLVHYGAFGLSATRSFFYGVFWAIPATAAVVVATKTEAAKRQHGGSHGGE